ncbi:hypothetical protein [Corynebacterium cystitidis]|uniref:hypothetical protein n=1 Tax=Corynebacterium cystitidis TaxID=35757 RepID=UPI00211E191B|nr:hypothetical protein [Corynebacterium cystitidis]
MNQPVFLGFPANSPAGKSIRAGREVPPDFPREWFEFVHPDDPNHIFSIDLTWIESTWQCRFGTDKCHGMMESLPVVGCCNHGAYLSDEADRDNLYNAVAEMPAKYWQLRPDGVDAFIEEADPTVLEPWLEWDDDEDEPSIKTLVVDGGCIFANRGGDDNPTGPGCALHQWAVAEDRDILVSKPEVCWQVPYSREDAWEERSDGIEILRTTISEYHRRQWGDGGEEFDWWCSGDIGCHEGGEPVWQTMADELRGLIGDKPYEIVAQHCRKRQKLPALYKAVHPATAAASTTANVAPNTGNTGEGE